MIPTGHGFSVVPRFTDLRLLFQLLPNTTTNTTTTKEFGGCPAFSQNFCLPRRRKRSSRSSQSSKQRTFLRRCSILTATSKSSVHHLEESAEEMGRVDGAHPFRFMAEGNMWLLELGASGIRVLADPWLVDNLIFWEQPWLFTGRSESRQRGSFPGDLTWENVNNVDVVFISQEWDDHCHLPTLRQLRKDIPVVASHKAAIRVQKLGFTSVHSLEHGTSTTHIPGLQIWATVGAQVGPPWAPRENGFVLEELETGLRIYYEPHCSFDASSVKAVGLVDAVITPGRQFKIVGFPLTEAVSEAVRLLHILQPQVVLPIQLSGLEVSGVTTPLYQVVGSAGEFEAALLESGIQTRVLPPPLSGHFMEIQIQKSSFPVRQKEV
ncbi:unnamed protein product [Sphagnum jensenii]|uniref:Metallo-beta-lactamase domain-containing protein n=1 Tax=Sphagnum jensenii TaxID=128206 RepID=A0ABP1B3S5_9BRYO